MRQLLVPILLGVVLLGIGLAVRSGKFARENPGAPLSSAMRSATTEQWSEHDLKQIAERFPSLTTETSGLRWQQMKTGNGAPPSPTSRVRVHYDGHLLSGGKFDSSRDRGSPQVFQLGNRSLIDGLEEALCTMRPGERRTLIIPWWLGYGTRGRTPYIPAFATLVFDIELLEIAP